MWLSRVRKFKSKGPHTRSYMLYNFDSTPRKFGSVGVKSDRLWASCTVRLYSDRTKFPVGGVKVVQHFGACMGPIIDTVWNLLEIITLNRLSSNVKEVERLSSEQFGFHKGRSKASGAISVTAQ